MAVVIWGLGVLGAAQAADNVAAQTERAKQPSVQELSRAEKAVQEVFGRDMLKARSTQEKAKLAQEILKTAREEQDPAVRFAALQAARRLATEAMDGQLGLEIVRQIVADYQPMEEMSASDRLADADRLWQQAEQAQGREKLAKQLEAIEAWLYADLEIGLTAKKWNVRINEFVLESFIIRKPYPLQMVQLMKQMSEVPVMLINVHSGFSMNVSMESREPGGMVMQYPLQKDKILPSSRWLIIRLKEDVYVLRNCHSGLFLTFQDNNSYLIQDVQKDSLAQQWDIIPTKSGTYLLKQRSNQMYLAPPPDKLNNPVGLYVCPPTNAGIFWKIIPVRP